MITIKYQFFHILKVATQTFLPTTLFFNMVHRCDLGHVHGEEVQLVICRKRSDLVEIILDFQSGYTLPGVIKKTPCESAANAATRIAQASFGAKANDVQLLGLEYRHDHGQGFACIYVFAVLPDESDLSRSASAWFAINNLPNPLHDSLREARPVLEFIMTTTQGVSSAVAKPAEGVSLAAIIAANIRSLNPFEAKPECPEKKEAEKKLEHAVPDKRILPEMEQVKPDPNEFKSKTKRARLVSPERNPRRKRARSFKRS